MGSICSKKTWCDSKSKYKSSELCFCFGGVPTNSKMEMWPFRIFLKHNELTDYSYKGHKKATCLLKYWHTCTPSIQLFEPHYGPRFCLFTLRHRRRTGSAETESYTFKNFIKHCVTLEMNTYVIVYPSCLCVNQRHEGTKSRRDPSKTCSWTQHRCRPSMKL